MSQNGFVLTGIVQATVTPARRKNLHGFHQEGKQHLQSPVATLRIPEADCHAESVALANHVWVGVEDSTLQCHNLFSIVMCGSAYIAQFVWRLDALARCHGSVRQRGPTFSSVWRRG